jgi:hypothetical protein
MREGDSFPEKHLIGKNFDMLLYLWRLFEEHGNDENRYKGCTIKLQN